jgi:hypothetical protein
MDVRWQLRRDRHAPDTAVTGREFNPVTEPVSQVIEIPRLSRRHRYIGFRGQFVVFSTERVLYRCRLSPSLFSINSLKPVTPVTVVTIEKNQSAAVSLVVTSVTSCVQVWSAESRPGDTRPPCSSTADGGEKAAAMTRSEITQGLGGDESEKAP